MGPVWKMWFMLGKCGSCYGNMGPVREMWVILGKCGSCYRNVGSVREMWVPQGNTALALEIRLLMGPDKYGS